MGFYTWILDSNLSGSVMNEIAYSSDSQRQSGFQSGTVASSIRVNTALRQSTLVTAALMESMGLTLLSYENSLADIKSGIDNFFAGLEVTPNPDMTGQTPTALSGLKIGGGYYNISGGGGTTVVANPSPAGTTDLTGISINGTKYKCADPSQVSTNTNAISGLNGSLISLQLTVGNMQPSSDTGDLLDSSNNVVGTYSWYKVNKVVYVRINSYTGSGTSVELGFTLSSFPSTNFSVSYAPFTYVDSNNLVKAGRIYFNTSGGKALVGCNIDNSFYARNIVNALNAWFTIILN